MAVFEIQGPDGKTYEVEAPDMASAVQAMQSFTFPQGGVSTDSQAVAEFTSKLGSMADGAIEGAKFGLGDNIAGARSALLGMHVQPDGTSDMFNYSDTMGQRYAAARDAERERLQQSHAANPGAFMTGNFIGAAAPAIAAAPLATGETVLGTALRGLGLGAFEGGLQGAGNADGVDVLGNTVKGTVLGGLVGASAPALVGGAGAIKNAVKDPVTGVIDGMFGIANRGKAGRALASAMRSSGKSETEIADALSRAAQQGQPEFRVMDALGVPGQRQASGIARSGGDAATEIANYLEKRQLGQGERVGSFVEDAFGFRGRPSGEMLPVDPNNAAPLTPGQVLSRPQRSAAQAKSALEDARKVQADIAFDAARGNAAPVDVRGAIGVIDDRIGGMKGAGITGDSIDAKLARYRSRLAGDGKGLGPDVSGAELSDFDRVLGVKQDVQDDIGAAVRAGRKNEARELGKLAAKLDSALEESSSSYRAANDQFRAASRVIDSVDTGAHMASRGRAADNVPAFQAMTTDMQSAARLGYGDDLLNKMERVTAPTSNRAKPLQSLKREAEADAMAINPQLYRERLQRENQMWETQNRALGGSRTADNEADKAAMGDLAGGAMGAVQSAANLRFGDAAMRLTGALGRVAKGQNEATRNLIVEALLSSDPRAILPAIQQANRSQATRRIIEALLRQPLRTGVGSLTQ